MSKWQIYTCTVGSKHFFPLNFQRFKALFPFKFSWLLLNVVLSLSKIYQSILALQTYHRVHHFTELPTKLLMLPSVKPPWKLLLGVNSDLLHGVRDVGLSRHILHEDDEVRGRVSREGRPFLVGSSSPNLIQHLSPSTHTQRQWISYAGCIIITPDNGLQWNL